MFRSVSVGLIIVALLACPFNCLSGSAGSDVAAEQPSRCPCCPQHCPPTDDVDPGSSRTPCRDDRCGNCLCCGAVFSKLDLSLEIEAQRHGDFGFAAIVGAIRSETDRFWSAGAHSPFLAQSGRVMRFVIQSLQI